MPYSTKEKAKAYRQRIKERTKRYNKEWREARPDYQQSEHIREYKRNWSIRNAENVAKKRRIRYFGARYGVTVEQYEDMLKNQNGVCAICNNKCSVRERLSIDHCHDTKIVRGLLCNSCNLGLGYFKDTPERLESAAKYLRADKAPWTGTL